MRWREGSERVLGPPSLSRLPVVEAGVTYFAEEHAEGLETGSVHCPRSHDRTAIQTHICRILKGGPLRDRSLHWPTGSRGPSGRKPQRGGPTSAPRGSFLSSPRLLQSPKGPHCVPAAPVLALSGELGAFTPLLGLSFPRIVVLAFPVGGFKEGVKGHRYPGGAN